MDPRVKDLFDLLGIECPEGVVVQETESGPVICLPDGFMADTDVGALLQKGLERREKERLDSLAQLAAIMQKGEAKDSPDEAVVQPNVDEKGGAG
jgi:hypothetical protein